jgi:FKBP-type peptidyl-prolyl cis-trans isomerase FklB
MKKVSYALGVSLASNILESGVESLDVEQFTKGLSAIINNESIEMSPDEVNQTLNTYFETLRKKSDEANIKNGEAFLNANRAKAGVTVTPSGLQYEVLVEGNGPKPVTSNRVKVHYTGTLTDGSVFDSSVARGEPATFGVTQVIPGWVEGLQLMPKGSKYRFVIPSALAYGAQGAGKSIGPNATLIFEVELLDIF